MRFLFTLLVLLGYVSCQSQDYSLDYFIQQAKQNNPSIAEFRNQILSNSIDSQILRANQKTQVNFLNRASYAPIIKGYGYDEAISNIADVGSIIQARRNFLSKQNLSTQYYIISLQKQALLDSMHLSEQDLVKTIAEQYITAYGTLLIASFNKEVFELMRKEDDILKKLTQASVYKQTDYLNFFVSMQQQELTWLQAQIQYNTDYLTLNFLAGINDTSIQQLQQPIFTDTLAAELYQSIFIHPFYTDSLRLVNEKKLINYSYKPKVGAYTDAGFTSSLQHLPYKNFGFSAGLTLEIPIYDGRQKQLKHEKIAIQERTRLAKKDFVLRQYQQQRAMLVQQLKQLDLLVNKISQQISYSYTLIMANNKLLEAGDISMRDYITSINNYLNAKNLLTQNHISQFRILNQYHYWNH